MKIWTKTYALYNVTSKANVKEVLVLCPGFKRRISCCNYCRATGFFFVFFTLPISIDCSLWLWRRLTKAWNAAVGSVPEVCEVPFAERHIGDNSWIHVHQKWQRNIREDRFQLVT